MGMSQRKFIVTFNNILIKRIILSKKKFYVLPFLPLIDIKGQLVSRDRQM